MFFLYTCTEFIIVIKTTAQKETRMYSSDKTEGITPNALINEKSPYLLQHAYNPVNWHPWGKEAFTRAKEEHKPIFLSIGYPPATGVT